MSKLEKLVKQLKAIMEMQRVGDGSFTHIVHTYPKGGELVTPPEREYEKVLDHLAKELRKLGIQKITVSLPKRKK